ncbi:MAG: hypothetical protein HQ591_03025 [candidate division Zixibacteria bacterium]|nr:hypothetical protein [Candidatus Tariuqbacter arcticus]
MTRQLDIDLHPQYLIGEDGKPKSVLIDYRTFKEIMGILEDFDCAEIIRERLNEPDEVFPDNLDDI